MPAGSETEFINPKDSKPLSPHSLLYNFEVAPGKEMPGGFYKGLAHSGQYSVKAFGQNSFSIAVERTAKEVGIENLKAVALSAWIYVFPTKKEVKGTFVFTASNELGVNVYWQGVGLHEPEVPRGKWFKISGNFDLSAVKFKQDYKLQIYFWNNSSTDILIDDYNIIFGGPVERRGDSARVDMTLPAGFVPRFNYPPFPVSYLEKETLSGLPKPADIGATDLVVAGNFMNTGNDGIFIISGSGKPSAFAFCPGNREFRMITLDNPSSLASVTPVKMILRGRFLNGTGDQVVISGDRGWLLAAIDMPGAPCSASAPLQANLKILWKSDGPADALCAGDFNGDHRTEILETAADGSWKVMSFDQAGTPGKWKVIASDDRDPVMEWNSKGRDVALSSGRFIQDGASDQVLTVTKGKEDAKCSYSLRKFSLGRMKWEPLFPGKQDNLGRTVGLDTLKPADQIAPLDNSAGFMRYNRDWRFDLKRIIFSDTTFVIRSTVDFQGYEMDHNPKYYESLALVPGHFLSATGVSYLVIGHNAKERRYEKILPDFIDLYSFTNKK